MANYVDVKDFGAIGHFLLNRGSISANTTRLTLDAPRQGENPLSDWVEGAGIAVAGAGNAGKYPHVTRISKIINDHTFDLEKPALHDAKSMPVTNDESLPVQAAIDSLGSEGGTVFVPPGKYRIGTTGRSLKFEGSNQPLFLGSNTRLVGAGVGATVLQLADDVRQRRKSFVDDAKCQSFDASIFVNRANGYINVPDSPPPPDTRLEVAHMTLDGNKDGQSLLYSRGNTTDPHIDDPPENAVQPSIGDPVPPPPNALVWGKGYGFAVSYTGDEPNKETANAGWGYLIKLPDQGGPNSPTVKLFLPPPPKGSKNVVVYVRTDDPNPCLTGFAAENYERQAPVPIPDADPIDPWNRPTLVIDRHAPPPDPPFLPPAFLTQFPGESSLSMGLALDNIADCYLHDLEIRNFVTDGLELSDISDGLFGAIWSHDNGRHGVGNGGQAISLRFVNCRMEHNASVGCSMEGSNFQDTHFLNCGFKNNGTGLGLTAHGPFSNISATNCDFDHNFYHLFVSAPATNLRIIGCTFRYGLRGAVAVYNAGYGAIMGCDFDQNSRPQLEPPDYDWQSMDVPQLVFQHPAGNWRVTGNRFRPFVSINGRTVTDGAMAHNSDTLTSVMAAFGPSDVGWPISVDGAGPAGAVLRTTIVGFTDSMTVTLFKAASSTVNGTKVTIGDGQKKANHSAAIELDGCLGMIISGNHFDVNPDDPEPDLPLKNHRFVSANPEGRLLLNSIEWNTGGGELDENGTKKALSAHGWNYGVQGNVLAILLYPEMVNETYQVDVSLHWDGGGWWVTDKTVSGFNIRWANAAGATTLDWAVHF